MANKIRSHSGASTGIDAEFAKLASSAGYDVLLVADTPFDEQLAATYHQFFRWWFSFGLPAFASVTAIFWLMITRPEISL